MNVEVEPGKYVMAVSGGVDSVVLLDLLANVPDLQLVVAHFDHGIRSNSAEDAQFVAGLAIKYGLPFVTERVELGPQASENTARQARYDFLKRVQSAQQARAIITAHHQDDVLETAIFNLRRGTGRRGLASLQSTKDIVRPLLDIPKVDIQAYALQHNLRWREDTTNYDERYARNYIRHQVLVRFDARARQQLLALIGRQRILNQQIDSELTALLAANPDADNLERQWFKQLPPEVAHEVMASWLRVHDVADFSRQTIQRLTEQARTKPTGKKLDVLHGYSIVIMRQHLALQQSER